MPESKFFKEVEFEEPRDPTDARPEKIVIWDKEKVKEAASHIREELSLIKRGQSELTPYAIDPGAFGFPAENALKIFERKPADKEFEGFVQIARQDWGARAAEKFASMLRPAREVVDNE